MGAVPVGGMLGPAEVAEVAELRAEVAKLEAKCLKLKDRVAELSDLCVQLESDNKVLTAKLQHEAEALQVRTADVDHLTRELDEARE